MKTQAITLNKSQSGILGTQKWTRAILSFTLLALMLFTQSCKKDGLSDPDGIDAGRFDERLIGTWENQEILGGAGTTQTTVVQETYNADGSGSERLFSFGPLGQTTPKIKSFSWFSKSSTMIHMIVQSGEMDVKVQLSDAGDILALTYPNGNRFVYNRIN